MADLLGATNPVPGYDGASQNRSHSALPQVQDPRVQNVPDLSRVSRADGRTEQQGAGNHLDAGRLRYDSNLQTFLQQLRDAPDLAAVLAKTVVWMRGLVSAPGLSEGIAQEMAQLLEMLRMDQEGFQRFFLNQMQAGNRFSGPLFSLLRQAYQNMPSEGMREAILNFAKRYGDFSAEQHLAENMTLRLKQMADYLPKSWRGQLMELTARLENGLQAGSRTENLKLLQGEIIPYLGSYVEQTHDIGKLRTLIGLLMLDVARYENGGEEGVLAAFRQLSGYGEMLAGLNELDDAALLRLLRENSFTRAVQEDQFAQRLAHTAAQALQGKYGADVREGFQELVRAFLLNESVFMPLNHMIIPLEWNGRAMYSELWVDPDAEDRKKGSRQPGQEKIQFLFKLDIQSLGYLEMTLAARQEEIELDIYGPDAVMECGGVVAEDLREILASHGLSGKNVRVMKRERPLALTEVFPDLFEGKRSVNVKV